MEQIEQKAAWGGAERKRVEAVVETLANMRCEGESLSEVAHDARNMVTALGLYCDLLEEPGVLSPSFLQYGSELRLVASASRRLVEKLVALDARQAPRGIPETKDIAAVGGALRQAAFTLAGDGDRLPARLLTSSRAERAERWDLMPAEPIHNLAGELLANRNLLAALAGPSIALTVDAQGCSRPVWLAGEDLTRILVNLVKNSAEAMPGGGRICLGLRELGLREQPSGLGDAEWLSLTIEDNGPGIPREALDRIFDSGFTTKSGRNAQTGAWPATHRGLGLAITRSIVEGAGGRIHATNRSQSGARFEIELPAHEREAGYESGREASKSLRPGKSNATNRT